MPGAAAVRKANKVASSRLLPTSDNPANTTYEFRILLSKELDEREKQVVWTIFEQNMHDLYTRSSFGWDPPSKLKELFDPLSRFVLVYMEGNLMAFSMFRFEYEESKSMVYCYDLQVSRTYQRTGLGKILIGLLENIGTTWGMGKIVLTVFKANKNAVNFYDVNGFKVDSSSPSYLEERGDPGSVDKDVDYQILSKELEG